MSNRSGAYLRVLGSVLLLCAVSATQCPMSAGPPAGNDNPGHNLAVFRSTDGFETTTVFDLNETPLQFDVDSGSLLLADGTSFSGWDIQGNSLSFAGRSFTVGFGVKNNQPRAYLTEGAPGKVVIERVDQGQLKLLSTVFEVPLSAVSGKVEGKGIYAVAPGLQGMFVIDSDKGYFICSAFVGGTTLGAAGNFTMVISGIPPIDRVRYDNVLIGGVTKHRAQFVVRGLSATVNNQFPGLPGDQGASPDILFDELVECTLVVEALDDDQGGDRYRATVYDSTIWPDGTEFKNFDGEDIATANVRPFVSGNITVTPPQ